MIIILSFPLSHTQKQIINQLVPSLNRMTSEVARSFQTDGGVNFEEFCAAVKSVGLSVLATRAVFNVFDMDNSGIVSPIEFISTLVQFHGSQPTASSPRSSDSDAKMPSASSPSELARKKSLEAKEHDNESFKRTKLYFSLFDLDGNGTIDRDELAYVVGMLMTEKSYRLDDESHNKNAQEKEHNRNDGAHRASIHTASALPTDFLNDWKTRHGDDSTGIDDDDEIPDTFTHLNDEVDYGVRAFDALPLHI